MFRGELLQMLFKPPKDGDTELVAPAWTPLLVLANLAVFIPLFIYLSYTLHHVYPALAIVENENPPAYEPVSLDNPDAGDGDGDDGDSTRPKATDGKPHPVTSSVRSINRLIGQDGWTANFRGFFCLLFQGFASLFLYGIFAASFHSSLAAVATLFTQLSLVQFSAAWVHIVITPRSPLHFWRRLPPFKQTFDATARATVVYWLATTLMDFWPYILGAILGIRMPRLGVNGVENADLEGSEAWKAAVVSLSSLLGYAFVVPAYVVLIRIQASLLPVDEDPIIPFDRSFQGRVEPLVVGGKGYATISDAWYTFSRSAWRRLLVLYVKIFFLTIAIMGLVTAVVIPQMMLVKAHSTKRP